MSYFSDEENLSYFTDEEESLYEEHINNKMPKLNQFIKTQNTFRIQHKRMEKLEIKMNKEILIPETDQPRNGSFVREFLPKGSRKQILKLRQKFYKVKSEYYDTMMSIQSTESAKTQFRELSKSFKDKECKVFYITQSGRY